MTRNKEQESGHFKFSPSNLVHVARRWFSPKTRAAFEVSRELVIHVRELQVYFTLTREIRNKRLIHVKGISKCGRES